VSLLEAPSLRQLRRHAIARSLSRLLKAESEGDDAVPDCRASSGDGTLFAARALNIEVAGMSLTSTGRADDRLRDDRGPEMESRSAQRDPFAASFLIDGRRPGRQSSTRASQRMRPRCCT